jgi:hypothetical protein
VELLVLRPAAVTGLLFLLACGGESAEGGDRATAPLEPTTRDSSGVTIHEHPADALERAPLITMDSVPMVVYQGSIDSVEQDVSSLSQFSFTSIGDLVAFDRQGQQVVALPADGSTPRRFGRAGEGPGEFGRYGNLRVAAGDTLVFRDGANTRIALLSPVAGHIREVSFARLSRDGAGQLIGRTSQGEFLLQHWQIGAMAAERSGPHRAPVTIQSWNGSTDSIVDRFVGGEILMWREVRVEDRGVSVLMRSAAMTVEPQIRVWDDALLVAPATQWKVERREPSGALLAVIRVDQPAPPLTDEIWSGYVDSTVAQRMRFDSLADPGVVRSQVAAEQRMDSLPVFSVVEITPNQVVWALDYRLPGDSGWAVTAFDQRGRILGRIAEPTGDPPVAFGNDRLAFRTEDEDGIATITVRRLRLPE